jgi:hypothetical protein
MTGLQLSIQLVREQGLHSVTIFSDVANVVDCISNKLKFATIEMVAQDCRDLLFSMSIVSVLFVNCTLCLAVFQPFSSGIIYLP